ncbi:MAG TPA: hypothetical protein VGG99_12015 [Acetobacteraceae bacterium]
MHDELLLVGSMPLDTVEHVFRVFGAKLGAYLRYLPDGEVGERRYWIDGIAYRVLNGHPEIETLRYPAPDTDGVESWRPLGVHDQFQFRVKPGVARVRFGDPGWRLGYTRDAVNSYFVFRTLKQQGVIPDHVRFQVCMPLTYSAVTSFFPDPDDHARIVPGFTAALRAEVAKMVELIPPADLAIQWDLAIEHRYIDAKQAQQGVEAAQHEATRLLQPAHEIASAIPDTVALGYHACFGTLAGWPSRRPDDLTSAVTLLNAAVDATPRRVDFLHLPTLGSADDAFFAPLRTLKTGDARVYLGAIHHMHGAAGLRGQVEAARKSLPEFGLAAPCGFGRAPERPGRLLSDEGAVVPADYVDIILRDHLAAAALA